LHREVRNKRPAPGAAPASDRSVYKRANYLRILEHYSASPEKHFLQPQTG
jgi:hypothetical protein